MPDAETLSAMYGTDYRTAFDHVPAVDDPKEPSKTLDWLRRSGRGVFIDYGCGDGGLLTEAARLNWDAYGVEFDPEVARRTQDGTGRRVVTDPSDLRVDGGGPADALHLGDVIEHLTDLERQFPEILRLVKPGGLLLAQGPLEANANLFTTAMRLSRAVRRRRSHEGAPYHVLLATARGQRELFRRFGLHQVEYSVSEVAWPAPSRLSLDDLARPRAAVLFSVRRLSQWVSRLRPGTLGNRYYYAGRRAELVPAGAPDGVVGASSAGP